MSLVEVRKLRKKIRQIECLEQLDRDLTADEVLKVMRYNVLQRYNHAQLVTGLQQSGQVTDTYQVAYLPGNLPGAAAPVPEDPQKHVRP